MRRFVTVVWITLMGVLAAGLTSAFAATGIAQEETVVLGEHTLKGRNLDLVAAARRVEDHARRLRGDVKSHAS